MVVSRSDAPLFSCSMFYFCVSRSCVRESLLDIPLHFGDRDAAVAPLRSGGVSGSSGIVVILPRGASGDFPRSGDLHFLDHRLLRLLLHMRIDYSGIMRILNPF